MTIFQKLFRGKTIYCEEDDVVSNACCTGNCTLCSELNAPAWVKVTLTGSLSPGQKHHYCPCNSSMLPDTYYLPLTSGTSDPSIPGCQWQKFECGCLGGEFVENIIVSLTEEDEKYKLRVVLVRNGSAQISYNCPAPPFENNYGEYGQTITYMKELGEDKPDCNDFNETLNYDSIDGEGDCVGWEQLSVKVEAVEGTPTDEQIDALLLGQKCNTCGIIDAPSSLRMIIRLDGVMPTLDPGAAALGFSCDCDYWPATYILDNPHPLDVVPCSIPGYNFSTYSDCTGGNSSFGTLAGCRGYYLLRGHCAGNSLGHISCHMGTFGNTLRMTLKVYVGAAYQTCISSPICSLSLIHAYYLDVPLNEGVLYSDLGAEQQMTYQCTETWESTDLAGCEFADIPPDAFFSLQSV